MVTDGKSGDSDGDRKRGKSQLRFYERNHIGVFDSKPLQQMLHETIIRDLPSHLLSK